MDLWPRAWQEIDDDIPSGESLVAEMKPFIAYLIEEKSLSRKTIGNHLDSLFLLGGEIIRNLNLFEDDRQLPIKKLLDSSVDELGGLPSRHAEDGERLRMYDATCRKLHAFRTSRQ